MYVCMYVCVYIDIYIYLLHTRNNKEGELPFEHAAEIHWIMPLNIRDDF